MISPQFRASEDKKKSKKKYSEIFQNFLVKLFLKIWTISSFEMGCWIWIFVAPWILIEFIATVICFNYSWECELLVMNMS